MALARFERDFTDDSSNLLTGNVTVAVAREAGGPQAVYSDRNGTASLGSTWVQSGGAVAFYAIGGAYRITVTQGAFSRELRYVPIGTKQEQDAGADFAGFTMSWETGTTAPPSAGSIRANNATLSSATSLFVSEANLAGSDISARLGELVAGDRIMLTDRDGRQASWNVDTGGVTDSGAYRTIAVTGHAGETSFSAGSISLQMQRKGAAGTNGVDGKFSGTEVIKTAAYTALAADSGKTIILNKATTDTLSFDAAATLGSTWMIMVKNIGAGAWTLDPNGSEQIDGATTVSLAQNESVVVSCNGTALRTLFRGSAAFTQFTAASSSAPAKLDLAEQTTNGTNKVTVQVPAALSADYTFTLPPASVTFDSFIVALLNSTSAAAAQAAIGVREKLTANRTYYVRTDGSDSNNGLANTSGGAFLTLAAAVTAVQALDRSIYNVTISIGAGTFTGGASVTAWGPGTGTVTFTGAGATTIINPTSANCFFSGSPVGRFTISSMKLQTTTGGNAIQAYLGGVITIGSGVEFGSVAGTGHIVAQSGGSVDVTAAYTISGNASYHLYNDGGTIYTGSSITVTVSGSLTFTTFAHATALGKIFGVSGTYSGGSVTAKKYDATLGSVINTFGGGSGYFPGGTAGTAATGYYA